MIKIKLRGEDFVLHEERCLFWPRLKLLVVADLHLGKSETFQQSGLWLSSEANADDLQRLLRVAGELKASEVLFLGDLVHSARGVTDQVRNQFTLWMAQFAGLVSIVIGNHDLKLVKVWPKEWQNVRLMETWTSGNFVFQHEPPLKPFEEFFYWAGHVHPVTKLEAGPDQIRVPSFVVTKNTGLLPAFSSLAGGHNIGFKKGRRIFPVVGNQVFDFSINLPNTP